MKTLLLLPAFVSWAGIPADRQVSPPHSPAATYYVDAQAGNDGASGLSMEAAWKSLEKVNSMTFAPGDRILFRSGGSWTGQFAPQGSGSEQAPILVDQYGGDRKPLINGNGEVENTVLLRNQQYWEISNLEITNHGSEPKLRRGVYVVADNYGEMYHIYLRSLDVHDVNGIDSDKVNGGIHYSAVGDSKPSRFVDLRIENNSIHHIDRSGIFGWSTHWVRSKWYPSLGVVVRDNRLEDIGGDGIVVVATDGALVEHNVVGHANQRSEGYDVAIWSWSADNTVIQYNEAYGTKGERDGEGFDSDWNSRNTLIQYNYSHDNDGGFLLICDEGTRAGGESIGNIGTVVRYNISQNDHHRGINMAGPVTNSTIYNNTIYVGKNEDVSLLLHSDWQGWASGTYLYNNTFYVEGKAAFGYGVSRDPNSGHYTTAPGFGQSKDNGFDANLYFGNVVPPSDAHALTRDPMLKAAGTGGLGRETLPGYQIQFGSPALDSGRTIANPGKRDFFGAAIPACGAFDRGAVEFQSCAGVK